MMSIALAAAVLLSATFVVADRMQLSRFRATTNEHAFHRQSLHSAPPTQYLAHTHLDVNMDTKSELSITPRNLSEAAKRHRQNQPQKSDIQPRHPFSRSLSQPRSSRIARPSPAQPPLIEPRMISSREAKTRTPEAYRSFSGSLTEPRRALSKAERLKRREVQREAKIASLFERFDPQDDRTFAYLWSKIKVAALAHLAQLDQLHENALATEALSPSSHDIERGHVHPRTRSQSSLFLHSCIVAFILFLLAFGSLYTVVTYLLQASRVSASCSPVTNYIPVTYTVTSYVSLYSDTSSSTLGSQAPILSTVTSTSTLTKTKTITASQVSTIVTALTSSNGPSYFYADVSGTTSWLNGVSPTSGAPLTTATATVYLLPSPATTASVTLETATIAPPPYTSTSFSIESPDTTATVHATHTITTTATDTKTIIRSSFVPVGSAGWNSTSEPTDYPQSLPVGTPTTITGTIYWSTGTRRTSTSFTTLTLTLTQPLPSTLTITESSSSASSDADATGLSSSTSSADVLSTSTPPLATQSPSLSIPLSAAFTTTFPPYAYSPLSSTPISESSVVSALPASVPTSQTVSFRNLSSTPSAASVGSTYFPLSGLPSQSTLQSSTKFSPESTNTSSASSSAATASLSQTGVSNNTIAPPTPWSELSSSPSSSAVSNTSLALPVSTIATSSLASLNITSSTSQPSSINSTSVPSAASVAPASAISSSSTVATIAPAPSASSAATSTLLSSSAGSSFATAASSTPSTSVTSSVVSTSSSTSSSTTKASSTTDASSSPAPSVCGEHGNFTLDFDDLPNFSTNKTVDITQAPPIFDGYHHLAFSNGYVYAPPPSDPYPPTSPPHLAVFLGNASGNGTGNTPGATAPTSGMIRPGEFGDGSSDPVSAYWFNAYNAWLGCDNPGPEPCTFVLTAYAWDAPSQQEVEVATQNETTSACPGFNDCHLQEVNFPASFTGLSGLQIQAYKGPDQVMFFMDDVAMGWWNNTCAAGLQRLRSQRGGSGPLKRHGRPIRR